MGVYIYSLHVKLFELLKYSSINLNEKKTTLFYSNADKRLQQPPIIKYYKLFQYKTERRMEIMKSKDEHDDESDENWRQIVISQQSLRLWKVFFFFKEGLCFFFICGGGARGQINTSMSIAGVGRNLERADHAAHPRRNEPKGSP